MQNRIDRRIRAAVFHKSMSEMRQPLFFEIFYTREAERCLAATALGASVRRDAHFLLGLLSGHQIEIESGVGLLAIRIDVQQTDSAGEDTQKHQRKKTEHQVQIAELIAFHQAPE